MNKRQWQICQMTYEIVDYDYTTHVRIDLFYKTKLHTIFVCTFFLIIVKFLHFLGFNVFIQNWKGVLRHF